MMTVDRPLTRSLKRLAKYWGDVLAARTGLSFFGRKP